METLSILFLGTQMAIGGAQKVLLDQAGWFRKQGHKVSAAFFYDRDGLFDLWKQSLDFPLYNLNAFDRNLGRIQQVKMLLGGMNGLWCLLKREKFDVVVTYTHDSNLLGLPLAWISGVPVRIATHLGVIRGNPRWRENAHSFLVNTGCAQVLVASSRGTYQNAVDEGVLPSRLHVISNGIQPFDLNLVDRKKTRIDLGLKNDDVFLLCVGRLVHEKGHEFLVHAMRYVIESFPQTVAGICGTGPLHNSLQSLISEYALDNHVKLLGQWDNISTLLAAADIFVLPSRWEGLSMALLEGMMAGLPIVATRVEGTEEVITDGLQGHLTPVEDSKALAEAIMRLINDPEKRSEMGLAARTRVLQNYTTDHMCNQYLKLMENLLK